MKDSVWWCGVDEWQVWYSMLWVVFCVFSEFWSSVPERVWKPPLDAGDCVMEDEYRGSSEYAGDVGKCSWDGDWGGSLKNMSLEDSVPGVLADEGFKNKSEEVDTAEPLDIKRSCPDVPGRKSGFTAVWDPGCNGIWSWSTGRSAFRTPSTLDCLLIWLSACCSTSN